VQAQLATDDWLVALKEEINRSSDYHQAGGRWDSSLGMAFLADEHDDRDAYVVLDLREGRCERAAFVSEDQYRQSTYRLAGPWDRWHQLCGGRLEPLKAIILKRLEFGGDLLRMAGFLPAAKALLDCACRVTDQVDEPIT
jgi:putative sterol carrier protein